MASTDFLYFAAGTPGRAGGDVHRLAQPGHLQRHQALPGRGRARSAGTPACAEIQRLAVEYLADPPPTGSPPGALDQLDLLDEYADHVRSFVDAAALRPLKVVADTANGMGGLVVPLVFGRLPFEVEILFPELDGTFPNHPADPIQQENLVDLKAAVLGRGPTSGSPSTATPTGSSWSTSGPRRSRARSPPPSSRPRCWTSTRARPSSTTSSAPQVVPEVIDEHGGVGVRTRVGHSFIKEVMAETGAVFGGEHSGHYYFRDNYRADSGIIAALVVLELLSRSDRPLSELLEPFRRYADSGEINTEVQRPRRARSSAVARRVVAARRRAIDRLDGLTVDHGDWWYNLRPSNTEPLLRLNVEARTEDECGRHVDEVLGASCAELLRLTRHRRAERRRRKRTTDAA